MLKRSVTALAIALATVASAAIPLRWTVETSRAQPAAFEVYQGETLDLEATLTSYGKPLTAPSDYALYWQTNGMGSVYWSTNCATGAGATNVMRATWRPEYDVGSRAYNCFIGCSGSIYRAAFQLRMRPSPGAEPNTLPLPTPTIDFASVTVLNPPWPTNDLTSAVASNAAAIASHSSQLSQLSQSIADHVGDTGNPHGVTPEQIEAMPLRGAEVEDGEIEFYGTDDSGRDEYVKISKDYLAVGSHASFSTTIYGHRKIQVGGRGGGVEISLPSDSGKLALTSDIPPPPGDYAAVSNAAMTAHRDATNYTDAAVASLDAALREYPRIVRRGGMYYTEDIIDCGGDDITYALTRFAVVTFTARENGTTVTSVINPDYSPTSARPTLEYATTPEWTWHPFVLGETSVTLAAGKRLHLRTPAGVTNGAYYGYSFRVPDGSANLSGDLMALVSCDGPKTVTLQGQFRELWRMCTNLVDASEFSIGATNTTAYAFSKLFDGCVSLTKAPRRLSFNDAKTYALNHFLAHCPITEAPEFDIQKATGERAMWGFFDSCAELESCDIRSLVDISGNNCIRGLFDYCYSLKRIEVGFTQFQNASYWVEDVPQTSDGVFVCPTALGNNDTITRATTAIKAGCPVNWTVINY